MMGGPLGDLRLVCGQCRSTGYQPANRLIPFTLAQPVHCGSEARSHFAVMEMGDWCWELNVWSMQKADFCYFRRWLGSCLWMARVWVRGANMQLWAGKATFPMWKKRWEWVKKKLQSSIVFNSMWLSQIKVWKKVLSVSKYSFFFSSSSTKGPESRKCWNPDSTMLLQEHPNVKIQFNTNYMQDNDVFTGGSKVINTSFHFQASENRLSVIAENIFTFSQVLANPAQGILITMHPLKKQVECMVQSTSNHTLSPSSCCRFPHQIDLCDSREHRPHPFRE